MAEYLLIKCLDFYLIDFICEMFSRRRKYIGSVTDEEKLIFI